MRVSWLSLYILFLPLFCIAQPKNLVLKTMDNYFLANKAILENGITCKVITKAKEFDKLFGIAKTQSNAIDHPDFATQQVLMVALPETNKEVKVKYVQATRAGNFIEVYVEVTRKIYPLPYTTLPLALAVIPKFKEVSKVKFYEGKRLVETVPVKQ